METANSLPRGIRNNNPLNIRYNAKNQWLGQTGSDRVPAEKGMCVFTSMHYGIRAAFKLLSNYGRKYGLNTVRSIITRWAPPSDDNNTEAYIKRVCDTMKCEPEFVPHFGTQCDMHECCLMVKGMIIVENGGDYVDFTTIYRAYCKAFGINDEDEECPDYLGILPPLES